MQYTARESGKLPVCFERYLCAVEVSSSDPYSGAGGLTQAARVVAVQQGERKQYGAGCRTHTKHIRNGRAGEASQKTLLSAAGRRTEEENREAQDHHYAGGEKREWVLSSWASDRGQV